MAMSTSTTNGTQLCVKVADHPLAGLKEFTPMELEAMAASLRVTFPENVKLVHYGPYPPTNRNMPWQKTLDDMITPVGGVKYFTNGQWLYPPGSQFSGPVGPVGPTGPAGPTGPSGPGTAPPIILDAPPDNGTLKSILITGGVGPSVIANGIYFLAGTNNEGGIVREFFSTIDATPNGSGGMNGSGGILMFSSLYDWCILVNGIAVSIAMDHATAVDPMEVLVWSDESVSGSNFQLAEDLPTDGTLAIQIGQNAIVYTSNLSGVFEDIWTASSVNPTRWQPPGQILRSPNGTLYRCIVSDVGVPSTERAYP